MNGKSTKRFAEFCFWIATLGPPIGILVLGAKFLRNLGGPLEVFYLNTANVFGDWVARSILGGCWMLLSGALLWRFLLSKHRNEEPGPPADLHD
jgi:hypothetical protein